MADVESEKAAIESAKAAEIQVQATAELAEAEPAMKAAADAVDCLSQNMLTELKNLKSPPAGVDLVTAAVQVLLQHEKSHKKWTWDAAKKMMGNVGAFKQQLQDYDGRTIPEDEVELLGTEYFLGNESFTVANMEKKSAAAANLAK